MTDEMKQAWQRIEEDFKVWDEKMGFDSSQRELLDWFKNSFESALTAANKRIEELEEHIKLTFHAEEMETIVADAEKRIASSIRERAAKICEDKYVAYAPEHEFARVAQLCATAIRQMKIDGGVEST